MRQKLSTDVISTPMTNFARPILLALALGVFAFVNPGCSDDQNAANQQLIQQQQGQIEAQQKEIEAMTLNQNQNQGYTPGVATSGPGGCDKGVEMEASHRGGEGFAANDFAKALAYYQDALAACPSDARAEVNVARTYEALGNKSAAINHYRKAADSGGPVVTDAQEEARNALERLQASRLQ
jgi:tetratricopeptide (TPR) repeat protein